MTWTGMLPRMVAFSSWALMILCSVPERAAASVTQPMHTTPLPPPRDGNVAVAEELTAARRAGTIAAYDLFIARHPAHRLAREARRERARLLNRHGPGRSPRVAPQS